MFSRLFRHVLNAQILEYPLWTGSEAVFKGRYSCSRWRYGATRACTPVDKKRTVPVLLNRPRAAISFPQAIAR